MCVCVCRGHRAGRRGVCVCVCGENENVNICDSGFSLLSTLVMLHVVVSGGSGGEGGGGLQWRGKMSFTARMMPESYY